MSSNIPSTHPDLKNANLSDINGSKFNTADNCDEYSLRHDNITTGESKNLNQFKNKNNDDNMMDEHGSQKTNIDQVQKQI